MTLRTPYYLIDERRLQQNLQVVERVRRESGVKVLLALKCFSTWSVFPLMRRYLDGTTSSSPYEARLGHEQFGGEVHAYSVGFARDEVAAVAAFADKVIFNSASQLRAHHDLVAHLSVGVRVNPGVSTSHFDLADPARPQSRLGITDAHELRSVASSIDGAMFHFNCENGDLDRLVEQLDVIGARFGDVLQDLSWVSLGGGISFTDCSFPIERFIRCLRSFADRHAVQIYLEPGEAVVSRSTELVTTVLDLVHNEREVAIVDASVEAHMLDHLIYRTTPRVSSPASGPHTVVLAGRTCLAGDLFGEHLLDRRLQVGDEVRFADAGGYTMVKANWFNGVQMPSIVVRRLDGTVDVVREFGYDDFRRSLS